MAAARRKAVGIYVWSIASILNCSAITGSATLIDEPMKGVRNDESVAAISTYKRSDLSLYSFKFFPSRKNWLLL
jgi:hypothetical protein